jgi:P27 family predicted phage terminase small subunit
VGRRGFPPAPTQLKLLKGERDPRRVPRSEPQPREVEPVEPDWLSEDQRKVWREAAGELRAMGMLWAADQHMLVVYSCAMADFMTAQRLIDRSGLLIKGREDTMVKNPLHGVKRDNANIARVLARELGLTPAGRAILGLFSGDTLDADRRAEMLLS